MASESSSALCKHLFAFDAEVTDSVDLKRSADRALSVCYFTGGKAVGPRLKATLVPGGGDVGEFLSDGQLTVDVRALLKTEDGAYISMTYQGLWKAPAGVFTKIFAKGGFEHYRPEQHYLRVAARFETDFPQYLWLNSILAIGIGHLTPSLGVHYEFHEVL